MSPASVRVSKRIPSAGPLGGTLTRDPALRYRLDGRPSRWPPVPSRWPPVPSRRPSVVVVVRPSVVVVVVRPSVVVVVVRLIIYIYIYIYMNIDLLTNMFRTIDR